MAQIIEQKKKNGRKSYFVRIRLKGKPHATKTFERLTDARLWVQETETAMRDGRYTATAEARKHTLNDLVNRYIRDVCPLKPKIANDYTMQLNWWKNQIGDELLSNITPAMISEQRNLLKKTISVRRKTEMSNATVNRYMGALSTAISTAV